VVLRSNEDKDLDQCMKLEKWPEYSDVAFLRKAGSRNTQVTPDNSERINSWSVTLTLSSIEFNGSFTKRTHHRTIPLPWDVHGNGEVPIASLHAYPFTHATPERRKFLIDRGAMFWECRSIKHIQYSGMDISRHHYFVSEPVYRLPYTEVH